VQTTPTTVNASEADRDAQQSIPSAGVDEGSKPVDSYPVDGDVSTDTGALQTQSDRVDSEAKPADKDDSLTRLPSSESTASQSTDDCVQGSASIQLPTDGPPPEDQRSENELQGVPDLDADTSNVSKASQESASRVKPQGWTCGSIDTAASTPLAGFVRFTDFALCDFNEDGVLDILALSSQLSTAFVYEGASTGIFTESGSLDLPFRPACSLNLPEQVGLPGTVFLVSGTGLVSLFVPIQSQENSGTPSLIRSVRLLGTENGIATIAVVDANANEAILYQVGAISAAGALEVGRTNYREIQDPFEWYRAFSSWDSDGSSPLPVLSPDLERITALADLEGTPELEMLLYRDGSITAYGFEQGEAVRLASVDCPSRPESIRIGDVNQDGVGDLLWLQAGTLRVVFGSHESS